MLRSTEAIGLVGGVRSCERPIRKCEASLTWLVQRPLLRGANREQTALPLDHNIAHVGRCRAYERDAAGGGCARTLTNPFGPRARLSLGSPRAYQPCTPIARRLQLIKPS